MSRALANGLKAPFPWFGGKSRVAHLVWDRFGNVPNYVEPFAGSLAVLLARPHEPKNETVNDIDAYLSNFWRALAADPESVADYADWPVSEADLHARHLWLVQQTEFRKRMRTDPEFFDTRIAGWWVWGISQWIGSGWCAHPEWEGRGNGSRAPKGIFAKRPDLRKGGKGVAAKRPQLPRGDHGVLTKRPLLLKGGAGTHRSSNADTPWAVRPRIAAQGINALPQQLPDISGDSGAAGRGVFASYTSDLHAYMFELASRLRRVRVCCGDWKRILGPSPTYKIGLTGVFLDPPYSVDERTDVYNHESRSLSHAVSSWAIKNGENPLLRIALCGYEGEHEFPDT